MGRLLKREVYAKLAAKYLLGTKIACCNQLHNRDLVLGENCKSAFDVFSSEYKSKIFNGARRFDEASLRRLLKKFSLENIL